MAAKRKLWSTVNSPAGRRRHESQAAAYRQVQTDARDWAAKQFDARRYTTVYVDERDGFGWRTFEKVDLVDLVVAPVLPDEEATDG